MGPDLIPGASSSDLDIWTCTALNSAVYRDRSEVKSRVTLDITCSYVSALSP